MYAQQAHGNPAAMPLDTWVETFLKWPLALYSSSGRRKVGAEKGSIIAITLGQA